VRRVVHALALFLALAVAAPSLAENQPVSRKEIDQAVETVKKDPNLASEKTVKTLHWDARKDVKKKPREPSEWPSWLGWLGDLFAWIGAASQMLMWLIIATLVALLAWFVVKILAAQRFRPAGTGFIPPTHVQDLDIRPESLPDDIGAAARMLWDRGDHRAALALLYRGLLSRLAHTFQVPIRDSSTEGDCLVLAGRKLEAGRLDYATRLVRTWQRAIYGGIDAETHLVHELCAQFDIHLSPPSNGETARTHFADKAA
jgi:hypothetical protein